LKKGGKGNYRDLFGKEREEEERPTRASPEEEGEGGRIRRLDAKKKGLY